MVRERLARYRDRARRALLEAFRERHTPHQVAASFAIGIFVTALPTGGLGIGLFFVFASLWSWISKPAIFASVAVLNPFVKPAVYVSSFHVGALVFGSESVRSRDTIATTDSAVVGLQQLLVGNVVVAVGLSLLGYVTVLRLTKLHRRRANRWAGASLSSTLFGPFRRE